jgi:predicted AlkP superfamily phosphohydrolase/phosphomutase
LTKPKVLVVGLDGATWDVLLPMIDKLPTIAGLLRRGASGRLRSCIPPVTAPAWKCYSTGKNPGKLGVYYQVMIDFANRRQELANSGSFHSLDMWDYMGAAGQRVAIINMPTTFPPKPVNGIMVTGPYSNHTGYTYPPELEDSLRARGYRLFVDELLMSDQKEACIDEVINVMESRFDLAKEIISDGDVDFLHVTIFHIDTIQHFLWGTPEMDRAWVAIDRFLGELLDVIPKECYVVLMSDHGFGEARETFYISTWMRNEGYLVLRPVIKLIDWMHKVGITQDSIYWLLNRTGLLHITKKMPKGLLRRVGYTLPTKEGTVTSDNLQHIVDWERSRVIPTANMIYLNPHLNDREELIQELVQRLKQLRLPGDNGAVVEDIWRREDLYHGDYIDKAFDLFLVPRPGVFVSHKLKQDPDPFSPKESAWKAQHALEGIFLISGPGVCVDHKLDGISIMDIAPTVMHLMELDIPDDMDGRVILEAFDKNSPIVKCQPRYQIVDGSLADTAEKPPVKQQDDAVIIERLRGLGYIE